MEQGEIEALIEGAGALGVDITVEVAQKLVQLTSLLLEANRKTNLTAVRDRREVLVKHHLDSLSLGRWIGPEARGTVVDVGSGAGFPGLVIAVLRPQLRVALVESVLRKALFLEEAVRALELANVRVMRERAEQMGRDPTWRERFDFATIRAVGSLALSLELCAPLLRQGGMVLVMKGPRFVEEWEAGRRIAAALGLSEPEAHRLELPGPIERVVVCSRKVAATPAAFPRRPGQLGRVSGFCERKADRP
ncbi:MAG TPA: 16S rRNA (guanine(527)-N(7))-methyltransferase RsmG [Limnochordales bacterium]